MTGRGNYVAHGLILSACAFFPHLVWEYVQCTLFFVHKGLPPTQTAMVIATLGDVLLTWIAYAAVAVVSGRWMWILERWKTRQWATIFAAALALSLFVEWRALSSGRWGYTELAPIIPGTTISVIPVLQLIILFPLSFHLTRYWLRRREERVR